MPAQDDLLVPTAMCQRFIRSINRFWQYAFFFAILSMCAAAQDRKAVAGDAKITGGGLSIDLERGFADNWLVGASGRFYLSSRAALEPEFLYAQTLPGRLLIERMSLLMLNATFDLRDAEKRAVPYLIGGVGWKRHTDVGIDFTSHDVHFSGGVGAKVHVANNWFFAPQIRMGNDPLIILTGSIGYTFGRRLKTFSTTP